MPRSAEELAAIISDGTEGEERKALLSQYADAVAAEYDAECEPPPSDDDAPAWEPPQINSGRLLIPGVSDGSISSIETLLVEHTQLLTGSAAPFRLNSLSHEIDQGAPGRPAERSIEISKLVTELRISCERKVCFETQKLDKEGRRIKAKLRIPAEDTKAALLSIARDNIYSPVREWLEQLPATEPGAIRLAATEALGLTLPLHHLLWRKWLIGCVARAMDPGCQLDTVLVLVAKKGGERKSSLFRALVGKWFSDTHLDMVGFKRQDSYMQLHRVWVYEVPELEGAKDAEQRARTKSFVSSRSDDFRSPYEATVMPHARSVALGATTNSTSFMTGGVDPAFDRRFWPITIAGKIDTDMVEHLREQIWSEALAAYRAKEPWHIEDDQAEQVAALQDSQADLADVDAWRDPVQAYVEAPARVTKALRLIDVMRGALGLQKKDCDMGAQRRVGSVLGTVGWEQRRARWRHGEDKQVRWVRRGTVPDGGWAPLNEPDGAQ